MSQSQINAMVASLMPGWGGKQCKLSGFLMGCGLVYRLAESGLAAPGSGSPPAFVWSFGAWRHPQYDPNTGNYVVFGGFTYTSITVDGKTSGAWKPYFNVVPTNSGSGFGFGFFLNVDFQRGGHRQPPQKTEDPYTLFKKFLAQHPECAKKIQQAGDKLNLGSYLKTPWSITDTYPALYDKPGVIPNQEDKRFSTPREFFDNKHPGWNAVTFVTRMGDTIVRYGTFLGEGYHYSYKENPDPNGDIFIRVRNSDFLKGATLLDESLHNYFGVDHDKLVDILGIDTKGNDPVTALREWIRNGCK